MLKKIILAFFVTALISTAFAQKQNNQWRFGTGGGIDFNTNPPSFVTGAAIATVEGSASIADKTTGALLFYTDGVTVWNALNQVMPNGTGLLGGSTSLSSTTAAVIIPKPSSTNLFYIVTIDEQFSSTGVQYSVVDMSLNGGLGDVLPDQKNIFLCQTTSEKLEVVPAADGQSFWLLTHDEPGNGFLAFRVNSSGIQTSPVISLVGNTQVNGAGHMKINRQFNKIAIGVTFGAKMELLDFDNATGVVSNPISWNTNLPSPLIYGVEFSPNGKVLYITNLEKLIQYDITQSTPAAIENSAFLLSPGSYQANSLQLGKDDKIYINAGRIDAINCPNKLGALCGFQQNVISGSGGGGYGLPKWIYYADDVPLVNTNSIIKTGNCQGLPISFSLQNTTSIVSVSWDFGDPTSGVANNTSSSLTPQHTFAAAGTYNVSVVVNYDCYSITLPLTVTIDPTVDPTFNSIPAFCVGDTPPLLPITSTNGIVGTWSPATVSNVSNGSHTFTPNPGQCATVQTITILVTPNIVPTFNPIPAICLGTTPPILPAVSNEGFSGVWSPPLISNTVGGTYTFTPNAGQCITNATISTTVIPCVNNQILYNETCLYFATTFSLQNTTDVVSVNWNFGEPSSGVNNFAVGLTPVHQYTTPGSYLVTATVTTSSGSYPLSETIQIQPTTLLTFSFPVQYLTGSAVPSLPATSNEGVPGTWSPSTIDPLNSGTYIFTPSVSGCFANNQVFISIVTCLTPTFTPIIKICPNVPAPTLPNTSLNGFTGVWSPSIVSNTVSSTYNFIPNPGQNACTDVSMYIEVASGPPTLTLTSPNSSLNQTVCVNEFIQDISIDLGGAAIGANAPNLPPGVFGSISGTVLTFSGIVLSGANSPYNYTISSTGGNCGTASISGTITVTPLVIPTFSFSTSLCFGQVSPLLPLTSDNGITGTWSPSFVSNTANGIYTFTPNSGQCADVKAVNITVNSSPIFNPIPAFCAVDAAPVLPTTSLNGITGTWSPATVSNTNSGTYTFTPNAGQCGNATPIQISITVNPSITPIFNPIPAFCAGDAAPILPTTSTNGITGTWLPATVSNMISGTYTFTPDAGQCATTSTLNLSVTPITIPAFNPIPPFTQGTTPPVLPTTSTNGITGTWSPPTVSNAFSDTYTFTPNAGQCATITSISITVSPLISPTFSFNTAICEGEVPPLLPTTSDNGLVGVWTPAVINPLASGYYTFTENATGNVSEVYFTVSPITNVEPIDNKIYCNAEIAPEIVFGSPSNGVTYSWTNSNPSIGLAASGEGNIPSFVATNTSATAQIATVSVVAKTTRFGSDFAYISNRDLAQSVSVFNIATNSIESVITVGAGPNGVQVSPNNEKVFICNTIDNSVSVIDPSTNAVVQTIAVGNTPLSCGVSPNSNNLYVMNSGDDSITVVDIATYTIITTIMLGQEPRDIEFSPDGSTFYVSVGSSEVRVFNTATNTVLANIILPAPAGFIALPVALKMSPDGSKLYVSNFGLENLSVISTATNTVIANIPVNSNVYAIALNSDGSRLYVASNTDDTVEVIDTSTNTIIATIPTGARQPNGIDVSADDTRVYVINNGTLPSSITIIDAQTNTVASSISLPNGAGFVLGDFIKLTPKECPGPTTTFSITVNPLITPTFNSVAPLCEGDAAPVLPTTSLNGITGTWSPATVSNTNSGIYTFTPNVGACATSTIVSVTIIPINTSNSILTSGVACANSVSATEFTLQNNSNIVSVNWDFGDTTSGINNTATGLTGSHFFSNPGNYVVSATIVYNCGSELVTTNVNVLPRQFINFSPKRYCQGSLAPALETTINFIGGTLVTGTWSPSIIDTSILGVSNYVFTPDVGQCFNPVTSNLAVTIAPNIVPTFNPIPTFCTGDTAPMLPTTSLNGITGTWSPATVSNTTSGTYTFTPNTVVGQCYSTQTINITVLQELVPDFSDLSLCDNQVGYMLNNESPNGIIGTWTPPTIDFTTGGSYTFTPNSGQCASSKTISVTINTNNLTDFQWIVSEPFASNATITIIPNSPGNYLYQLDFGPQQTSNVFENVSASFHTVKVIDANGCSDTIVKDDILIIDYPKFFTPNGDGYNDIWNINTLSLQKESKIYIYDRYGKLLQQLFPFNGGWDGKYNNRELLSDDYWFVVEYEYNNIPRQFKSHFSLKR
jgi:gliding motility-associated-like protein